MSQSVEGTPRAGAAALNNMALMNAESNIFKVPALPKTSQKNKAKSKVMDEDDYVEGIARIIQRDFFPDLEKLRAQNEYLEATENKDYVRLQEITRKYSGARPHTNPSGDASPATFDTPNVRPGSPTADTVRRDDSGHNRPQLPEDELDQITKKHTLDSYLARHTSEDNSSYERLIALEDKRKAAKLESQFEAEVTSAALADRALELPSIEQQADQTLRPHELDTWRYKARNYIMYVPDGGPSAALSKPELQHANTRLQACPFNNQTDSGDKNKNKLRTGKIGVDGNCVDEPPTPLSHRGLVTTPSPRPGSVGDESPLMTWGEIEGTPFRLDGGDTPLPALGAGRSYHMLECTARERIGLQLAEQAAKKRRPTTPRLSTPTPRPHRTGSDRLSTMSPAARKLAAKHILTPRLKVTPVNVGVLSRTATTPKPTWRRTPVVATPGKKPPTPKIDGNTEKTNLTDNLLQINLQRRMKAEDFFK